ncbi:glycerol-3-phosphate dehydrogenase [NAD+], glycosomal [Leishmania panamensis]|uniref:Glycerol-3-phosphate dehydrogenase [NAD(+)] n=3 Tax=Leishmania guyanensis species complex TaxID=38579 RepID=A0A088S3Q4_LEIPA|nr:glycerol-3-phosphate dehydrogenase [NAD+], glycosomal [Leishmania panamensis]AIN96116.1 glycerol-3-phosphate dehydrogenase [NAD+], glycosomal [Leishmania panamensis]CCM13493.1 Putative glycerol-3-phosphate dehydrogenase [NAD ], glycosomal [Leishmania guyanensis]
MLSANGKVNANELLYLKKAVVFGSGAFGTALATVLAKKCREVCVWHIKEEEAQLVNRKRENMMYLKGVKLASNITFTSNVEQAYKDAEIILFVIPTQFLRGFFQKSGGNLITYAKEKCVPVLVCTKGIERSTLKFPAQIVGEFFADYPLSVLAGPSFAIEVAAGIFTCVGIASADINQARRLQRIMTTGDRTFVCWATTDTIGFEVASAVKNVLAIGSGVANGLGMGFNARAALITRGLLEIRDLTGALGGDGSAVFGLAGLGDLQLTCSSELSRNFTVGKRLGEGTSIEEIQRTSKAVAEGVATAEPLMRLAQQLKVSMPLCKEIYKIVYEKKNPRDAIADLLSCGLQDEGLPALFKKSSATLSKL